MPRKPRSIPKPSSSIPIPPAKPPHAKSTPTTKPEILPLASPSAFRTYILTTPDPPSILLPLTKLSSPSPGITYNAALRIALSHGWIDAQRRKHPSSPHHFLQHFGPRRKGSLWSKRNVGIVEELMEKGEMTERGMREVELAKEDGRWERAYSGGKDMLVPEDFGEAVKRGEEAEKVWEGLGRTARFLFLMKLETAKDGDARAKRIEQFVEMLAQGKTF